MRAFFSPVICRDNEFGIGFLEAAFSVSEYGKFRDILFNFMYFSVVLISEMWQVMSIAREGIRQSKWRCHGEWALLAWRYSSWSVPMLSNFPYYISGGSKTGLSGERWRWSSFNGWSVPITLVNNCAGMYHKVLKYIVSNIKELYRSIWF